MKESLELEEAHRSIQLLTRKVEDLTDLVAKLQDALSQAK